MTPTLIQVVAGLALAIIIIRTTHVKVSRHHNSGAKLWTVNVTVRTADRIYGGGITFGHTR